MDPLFVVPIVLVFLIAMGVAAWFLRRDLRPTDREGSAADAGPRTTEGPDPGPS